MATRSKTVKHVHYHKDGSVYGKGSMKDGKMHGYWEWFRKDGSRMRSGHFDKAEQVGEWITYDKKGEPFKTTIMKGTKGRPK
jgi:antitoxin component YwqK of YwqJK toxin-antitoxin module